MAESHLDTIARSLVHEGKGILAADESIGTIKKRFEKVGIDCTPEARQAYREMLFTTPGIEEFLSGVIMFDETVGQWAQDGATFVEVLAGKDIIPGIKVDLGAKDLANFPGEKITEGLDGLRERLANYRELGAQFTKWRAVVAIGEGIPTQVCIDSNAECLARFAALSQEAEMVPIVEPEVLIDGDHTIERCAEVTLATLKSVFARLDAHRVNLAGMLLKPNMVLSGKENGYKASPEQIAEATVSVLRDSVPMEVPGVVFLSGGQSPEQATAHLDAMNRMGAQPWQLAFSFARALQEPSLLAWKGHPENVPLAQRLFYHRAKCASAARRGQYTPEMEDSLAELPRAAG